MGVTILRLFSRSRVFLTSSEEDFCDIQLNVRDFTNMLASLTEWCALENLPVPHEIKGIGKVLVARDTRIGILPPVLQFHLRRFSSVDGFAEKIYSRFEIEPRIDVRGMCVGDLQGCTQYVLQSVIVHSGVIDSGHYYAFTNSPEGWLECNDRRVTNASLADVLEGSAGGRLNNLPENPVREYCGYVLVYVRIDELQRLVGFQDITDGPFVLVGAHSSDPSDGGSPGSDRPNGSAGVTGGAVAFGGSSVGTMSPGNIKQNAMTFLSAILSDDAAALRTIIVADRSIMYGKLSAINDCKYPDFLRFGAPWLGVAAFFDAPGCVDVLLAFGGDVTACDDRGVLVACFAAAGGGLRVVNTLEAAGVDFQLPVDRDGLSAAEMAAWWGRSDFLTWLATKGYLASGGNPVGFQPPEPGSLWSESRILTMASGNGHVAVVRFLLNDLQLPVNLPGDYQLPTAGGAVHAACRGGHHAVLVMLADRGADLRKANGAGDTPLVLAVKSGSGRCVRELLSRGVPLTAPESGYLDAVAAAREGHLRILKELIKLGRAEAHATDATGLCPLVAALRGHHIECARWLVTGYGFPPCQAVSIGTELADLRDEKLALQALHSTDFGGKLGLILQAKQALWARAMQMKWKQICLVDRFREEFGGRM
jgi:hypothetical protein